ncbi:hypothetical protein GCM10027592_26300 [Spirosoma flavus]
MSHSQSGPTKAVVFAYFAHQATPLERQAIEAWLATDEGTLLYYTYLDEWEREHPQFYPDSEAARQRFTQFIRSPLQSELVDANRTRESLTYDFTKETTWFRSQWLIGLAASVALLAGVWLTTDFWYYTTLTNGYRQIRSVSLPDGSGVLLGTNSSVRYARFGFSSGIRQVWLDGEAEFQIVHTPESKRFTVETPDHTIVEVLGTVFVVNSRRNSTQVVLETGRIKLTTPRTTRPVVLSPGDMVTVSARGQLKQQHLTQTPSRVIWHDHQFVFADTPLSDVANQLHDTFGVTVQIPQAQLMTRTVSGTFQAETADDLLQALAMMMNLQLNQAKEVYILTN